MSPFFKRQQTCNERNSMAKWVIQQTLAVPFVRAQVGSSIVGSVERPDANPGPGAAAFKGNGAGVSDQLTVIQRVIQLTREIEKTYGFGKTFTFGSRRVGGYTSEEWAREEERCQRWLDTAREWERTRNPLIAELQTLVELHRYEWPELFEVVERQPWVKTARADQTWAEIRRSALAARGDDAAIQRIWSRVGGKMGRAISWLHQHYLAPLLVGLIVAAVLAWIGLVP